MYHIPGEDDVAAAISYVLSRYGTVRSQRELARLVMRSLRNSDRNYRLSGTRVRQIALKHGVARIIVETREAGNSEMDIHCPVCGTLMQEIRNRTLDGKTVIIGYDCPACSYRSGIVQRRPQRYIFLPRETSEAAEEGDEDRAT